MNLLAPRLVAIRDEMQAALDDIAAAKKARDKAAVEAGKARYHEAGARHRALLHANRPDIRSAWEASGGKEFCG